MLGSILSNLLLVLGCCFLAGGLRYREQFFNLTVASTMSSLLAVASASLIIPATLYDALENSNPSESEKIILFLSRGTALVLLVLYAMYLIFQLKTHSDYFDEERQHEGDEEEEEAETPTPSPWTAGLALAAVTVIVAACANYLVGSINSFVETAQISKIFVGLILIPIIGNAAEHTTAVVVAYKNKMELAIAVALGSCLQIALFVTPFLVLLGWIIDRPMTLHFDILETVAFFLSGFVVALLIQDGKSNYLEGALCLGM
jgi:Ca2+:H+ antiporter